MRVQLQGQALRLRIRKPELDELLAGATLDNLTTWPDGTRLHQRLVLDDASGWDAHDDGWCMHLARAGVVALAARLPSRDGIAVEIPVPGGAPLQVLFDVDVRERAGRRRHASAE